MNRRNEMGGIRVERTQYRRWGALLPLVVMVVGMLSDDVVVGQQIEIFGWATNLVDMLLVMML
jgi:hypothetical protein